MTPSTRGPRIVAVLMFFVAINALAQAFRRFVGWEDAPILIGLEQFVSGSAALVAAIGAWTGRPWSAAATVLYGVLGAVLVLSLIPLLGVAPELRSGLWIGAAVVLVVCGGLAWYLQRALRTPAALQR